MLTDYHTHTRRCGHAAGGVDDYVRAAVERGIAEVGLSDHLWLYHEPPERRDRRWAMPEEEFDAHYAEMLDARERWRGRANVRVAVEADYIEGRESELAAILSRYELDYVLGGVHFIDEWMIDDEDVRGRYDERPVSETYREYYRRLRKAAATGLFDLIAHFDLPKKFGHRCEVPIDDAIDETLDAIARSGVAVELSSAGLRKSVAEIYPSPEILREMNRRGIPIALSSDAHDPRDVGFAFDRLVRAARDAGYRRLVTFDHRVKASADLG